MVQVPLDISRTNIQATPNSFILNMSIINRERGSSTFQSHTNRSKALTVFIDEREWYFENHSR